MLAKIFNRLKNILQYYKIIAKNDYNLDPNSPIAFIDFKDRRFDVYYSCLLYFLHDSGYQLVINKSNMLSIGNTDGYFKCIPGFEKITYLRITDLENRKLDFDYFYDLKKCRINPLNKKVFKINLDYFKFNEFKLEKIVAPYPLHPSNYLINKSIKNLEYYRLNSRKFKIFFFIL